MEFRNVPFKYVPLNVCKNLAQLMDVRCSVYAADWTSLGAEIGLTFVEKKLMEEKLNGNQSNTMALFESWSKNPQNTVGKILDALEKIKRPHEIRMLNEAKNEILESYFNSADADSVFQLCDKIKDISELSVDLPSETTSTDEPYYLNTYERYPSNVISEERNSRQLTHSIPDTSSLADSRYGRQTEHEMNPSLDSSMNDLVIIDKNYNRTHSYVQQKIGNCGAIRDKRVRVFITYGTGNNSHDSKIFHFCKYLDKYFYCNVDLKGKRIGKDKVDEYFKKADFVLICFDQEYMRSIHRAETFEQESPEKLHTAYIYLKMKTEAAYSGSKHRFIPVVFKGGSADDIPLWIENKHYKWPEQSNDLALFLSNPQNTIHFTDDTFL